MTYTYCLPEWLPLLVRVYEDILSSRVAWDLALPAGTRVHIERGSQGWNNLLYRVEVGGQVYACKVFIVDERRRAQREWLALNGLHAAGLPIAPVPVALAADGPLPQPVVIMEWVEGISLSQGSLQLPDLMALVADMARIHSIRPTVYPGILPAWHLPASYEAYLAEAESFLAPVCQWLESGRWKSGELPGWVADLPELWPPIQGALAQARAAILPLPGDQAPDDRCWEPCLVRMDCSLDNVLRGQDGRLLFVDWEYSGWGDPAYDLAELRWHPRSLHVPPSEWSAALATYPPMRGDPSFGDRLAIYDQLLPAWWVARSALTLLEGIGEAHARQRVVRLPTRLFRGVRTQLNAYLAALGLLENDDEDEPEED